MASTDVWIAGSYQSDYARNYAREGLEISDMVAETVTGTLTAAGLAPEDVEAIHVGNAFGQLFTGQGQLGAMPATVEPLLWGKPAARHEAACASGSVAVLAAMAEIEAGHYDCVLVLGVEQERNVPGTQAPRHLGAAAWIGHEGESATFMWPYMFSQLADEYDRRYGLDESHLRAIAELNMRNAKDNPLAQTRSWSFTADSFSADDTANPVVEGRLRRTDCGQVTDGTAGVVLVSGRFLAGRLGGRAAARIAGWGHGTAGLALQPKLDRSKNQPYVFPHVRQVVLDAFRRGGIADVSALDAIETHDCFSMSEYMAIDHFGITGPGESWKAVENGELERGGTIPVNPGGGLIGIGHPVGASGVRMLHDAARQVTGHAGDCQVDGAATVATLNIGGSLTTAVSFIVTAQ
ncbi:MAG TPA: acetyl-CoA acetyltransferase [Streptosporangiaceae bacterium]|jgi:acetyl-CoA C-acetyltransferase|nr:acetyl-CoA acetyltransferase [Streptosporangiaceae bacterium]